MCVFPCTRLVYRYIIINTHHAYTHFQTCGTASPADPWLYRTRTLLCFSSWDTASVSTNTQTTLLIHVAGC